MDKRRTRESALKHTRLTSYLSVSLSGALHWGQFLYVVGNSWVETLVNTRFDAITLGNSSCVQVVISLTSSKYPELTVLNGDFGLDIARSALAFMQHTRLRQAETRLHRVNF